MGSLLWLTPSSIRFQINRIDVYSNGCATNSFHGIDSDYASGCGFVDINFVEYGADTFPEVGTRQHLDIYNGFSTIEGENVVVRTLACNDRDILAVEITDHRKQPVPIRVTLRVLRYDSQYDKGRRPYRYPGGFDDDVVSVVRTNNHLAVSTLSVAEGCAVLTQEFTEGDFCCKSAVAVSVVGRNSRISRDNEMEYSISAEPCNGSFLILVSSAAGIGGTTSPQNEALGLIGAGASAGFAPMLESNRKWWNGFWNNGSYISLHSEDGDADMVSEHCNYFMYLMACVSRGVLLQGTAGCYGIQEGISVHGARSSGGTMPVATIARSLQLGILSCLSRYLSNF